MSRKGEVPSREHSTERGASPQVGIVLLFGLVIIGATLVFSVGMVALDAIQMQATGEQEKQVLQQFDKDLTDSVNNDDVTGSVYLGEGQYNISNSSKMSITTSNGFKELAHEPIQMGTLVQEGESGAEFGYQAGGIWRSEGGRTTVVSKPDLRYYKGEGNLRRIDLSLISLRGNAGPGENTVEQENGSSLDVLGEGEFVSHVELTVEGSQYHDGWYRFMRDEFEATDVDEVSDVSKPADCDFDADVSFDQNLICHEDETVTVVATIDGNNPFAHHVGIEPTIYGGLSADSIDSISGGNYEDDLNVSGYSNHDRSNSSTDLFTVDSDFELNDDADIEGYPVVNGPIIPSDDSTVDPIAYVSDPTFDNDYITNGTEIAKLSNDVIAANMSRPFQSIDGIDDEINNGALGYLEDHDSNEKVTSFDSGTNSIDEAGRYYTDEFDVSQIDTSDGDVHIGVGGFKDGTLSGLTVSGENQVYIYTDEDVSIDDTDTDNRAGTFWLYGTRNAAITFEDSASFEGVIYAPDSPLDIEDDAEITGAVVSGVTEIGNDVTINFDRSLRTDVPIPDENQDITIEEARAPLDVTFVLDGSGSMGGTSTITGDTWQRPSTTPATVHPDASHSLEIRRCESSWFGDDDCSSPNTIDPGESFDDGGWNEYVEARVKDGSSGSSIVIGDGNDPFELRADATKDFIEILNESNDDRAGVFEFDTDGETLHELSGDLSSVGNDVSVSADGGTDTSSGMDPALNEYDTSNGHDRVMVLLSDGENTARGADSRTEEMADEAIDKDVTIYTIGLGNNVDEELLTDTASATGGEYYNVDNAEELEERFQGIANRVTADEEVTFNVGDIPDPGKSSSDYVVNIETQQVRIES